MISLDLDRVRELAREVVAEFGEDYVYDRTVNRGCAYVRNDAPSCLVAQILFRAGVSIDTLRGMDCQSASGINILWQDGKLEDRFDLDLSLSVVAYLAELQVLQDRGETWGYCLQNVEKSLN